MMSVATGCIRIREYAMSKYITATEASRRLGVTDKTVRTWVKDGKLDAHHVAKNKLAILAADVEALRRKRENYQDETPDISHLVARIAELERMCADLDQKYTELAASVAEKVEKQPVRRPARSPAAVSQKYTTMISVDVPADIPDGSMLFADFAEKHGVPRATFSHHVKVGIAGDVVASIKRPKPSRPEHTEYWLSPDQQVGALAYWDRHGVQYRAGH
jgi:excisionase family DNA binding protein